MKVSLTARLLCIGLLTSLTSQASAMGQRAQVFETSAEAGIWDHGNEFYLRMDLAEIADLKEQKFVWAGFHRKADGTFQGEIVCDNFGANERKFPARAKLLESSPAGRFFFIEVLNDKNEVIKEMFVKGAPSALAESRENRR